MTGMCLHAQLFLWMLETDLSFVCLHSVSPALGSSPFLGAEKLS